LLRHYVNNFEFLELHSNVTLFMALIDELNIGYTLRSHGAVNSFSALAKLQLSINRRPLLMINCLSGYFRPSVCTADMLGYKASAAKGKVRRYFLYVVLDICRSLSNHHHIGTTERPKHTILEKNSIISEHYSRIPDLLLRGVYA